MELNKIIDIIEGTTGNALPWKVIDGKNKQLPENPKWHLLGTPLNSNEKFDLVVANNTDDIPTAEEILEDHGKLYLCCKTTELKEILKVAHKNELFWAECRNENELSHLILRKRRNFPQPRWSGQKGDILLHCDWGWGDNIQFLRYCKLVKEKCQGKVILEVRLGLEDLCQSLEGVDEILIKGQKLPKFDYHAEVADMEKLFSTIPSPPYLFAKSTREHKGFNIGCVWHGHHLTFNFFRFYNPELLRQFDFLGVRFFGFQKSTDNRFDAAPDFIEDLSAQISNWNDTANLLSQMDLLITVDTAICHLSGALGIKTWVILPKKTYNTPITTHTNEWYPNIKLFINKEENDWSHLFEEIKEELQKELLKRLF